MLDKPYVDEIKEHLDKIGYQGDIYQRVTPVKSTPNVKPLTRRQRTLVNSLSKERGFRIFTADKSGI